MYTEIIVYRSWWQRIFHTTQTAHVCVILILLLIIGGIGVAHIPYRRSNKVNEIVDQKQGKTILS
jgi:hypothetical protein